MKKLLFCLVTAFVGVFLFAAVSSADEVKTDDFTITLADGWTQPDPVQNADGTTIAIVQYPDGTGAVSIAVTPAPLSAKELAEQTLNNMKAGGFTVSSPVASGESYVGEFSQQQAKGVSYFTSNGRKGSVVTIVGTDTAQGKDFLNKNFRPADAKLFPASF
ncbi:hypothetical protein [uncultured Mailhella sp.]|uniref:hypothetical protein n=1 Tax=uncultured Mailhella sp. TaxID=1981031 RepID=UPI0025D608A6|nr:hypothetical protein [uncultured Mailhella sp.]